MEKFSAKGIRVIESGDSSGGDTNNKEIENCTKIELQKGKSIKCYYENSHGTLFSKDYDISSSLTSLNLLII